MGLWWLLRTLSANEHEEKHIFAHYKAKAASTWFSLLTLEFIPKLVLQEVMGREFCLPRHLLNQDFLFVKGNSLPHLPIREWCIICYAVIQTGKDSCLHQHIMQVSLFCISQFCSISRSKKMVVHIKPTGKRARCPFL